MKKKFKAEKCWQEKLDATSKIQYYRITTHGLAGYKLKSLSWRM